MNLASLPRVIIHGLVFLSVAYPALVYFAYERLNPAALAILFTVAFAARSVVLSRKRSRRLASLAVVLLPAAYVGCLVISSDPRVARGYPVLVNAMLLAAFAWTLHEPPSMAERLARASGAAVSVAGVSYTRWVTIAWCIYFALNCIVTIILATWYSLEAWALYTGLVSYLLAGALMAVEFGIRQLYRRHVAQRAR